MKKSIDKKTFLFFVVITLFCLFRFQESFFKNKYSEFYSADGYGAIGGYQMFIDQVHKSKNYLFSDVFRTELLGEGILEPGPFSVFWKLYFYFFSFFFDSFQINTYSVFFIALLNGLFFYILINTHTKSKELSFVGSILIISLYNFHIRANGHLTGLGSIFMPILLFTSLLNITVNNSYKSYLFFALCNILNFNSSEYYGFYGLWISGFVCLFLILHNARQNKKHSLDLIKKCSLVFFIFLTSMAILYPTIIRERILSKLLHEDYGFVKGIVHAPENIYFYSVQSLKEIFLPNRYFFTDDTIYKNPERTYSIGIIIIIICFINLFFLRKKLNEFEKRIIYVSFITILISILICLDPRVHISLAAINAKIAPMFRVTYRSLIYFDISFVFLFLYTCNLIINYKFEHILERFKGKYVLVSILLVGIELPYPHLFRPVPNQTYPDSRSLTWLKNEPEDIKVVEIPYYPYENGSKPESNYRYVYNYFFHRKETLNFPYSEANNDKFKLEIDKFSNFINSMTKESIFALHRLGVKYVIYNYESSIKIDLKVLKNNKYLDLISDDKSQHAIFKINLNNSNFNTKNIVFDFLMPKDNIFDFSDSCIAGAKNLYHCGSGAKIKFYNYYDHSITVEAIFLAFDLSDSEKYKVPIKFSLPAKHEQIYRIKDLIPSTDIESYRFKVSEVKLQ